MVATSLRAAAIVMACVDHRRLIDALGAALVEEPPLFARDGGFVRAGYRTALAGKWHLGYPPAFGPLRSGYDEFFGPMSGGVDYFSHCDSRGTHDLWQGEAEHREEGYLTDLISRRAVDFRRSPFALQRDNVRKPESDHPVKEPHDRQFQFASV